MLLVHLKLESKGTQGREVAQIQSTNCASKWTQGREVSRLLPPQFHSHSYKALVCLPTAWTAAIAKIAPDSLSEGKKSQRRQMCKWHFPASIVTRACRGKLPRVYTKEDGRFSQPTLPPGYEKYHHFRSIVFARSFVVR